MNDLHRLLKRQIKKHLGTDQVSQNLQEFIRAVNSAYYEFEEDRELMERCVASNSEKHMLSMVETIPQGIININCDGEIAFANSAAVEMFGLPRAMLLKKKFNNSLWRLRPANKCLNSCDEIPFKDIMQSGQTIVGSEYILENAEGVIRSVNLNAAPLHDSQGKINGLVVSLEDITQRKEMEEQLKYISLHDPLTGLYNRSYFEEQMRRTNGKENALAGIVIIDIDGLKLVNDTLGHDKGDSLLQTAANIIKEIFSEWDVAARIGGDEFALFSAPCSVNTVEDDCASLRKAIALYNEKVVHRLGKVPLSISVGCAVGSKTRLPEIFREADNNMYREKLHHHQSARNTIVENLIKAMEARNYLMDGHTERMNGFIRRFGEALALTENNIRDLLLLAQFHDIGKVGIPDRILFKPGPLTNKETMEMQRHCEIGHRIAQASPDMVVIADWILKHHEFWDGSGYPLGLKGKEIPLECRILLIVDAYDAMTSDRTYRSALEHKDAVAELVRCSGILFDPELVQAFLKILKTKV